MNLKSIFASKTFWFNVATAATTYSNMMPPRVAMPVSIIGNILLRFLTKQPVTITF